jgi:hypothetical protein
MPFNHQTTWKLEMNFIKFETFIALSEDEMHRFLAMEHTPRFWSLRVA